MFEAAGVYEPARFYYVAWFGLSVVAYIACLAVLLGDPSTLVRILAIGGVSVAMMQLGLFAHDVGHGAVVRGATARTTFEFIANALFLGYGCAYGQDTHNAHHRLPNQAGSDPDLDSSLFALHEGAALGSRGLLARLQPLSIFVALPFWAFSIRISALIFAFKNVRWMGAIDLALIGIHLGFWLGLGTVTLGFEAALINYVVVTLLVGTYMGAILVLPHVGASSWQGTSNLPHFEHQIAASRNYCPSRLGTLICGGLNLQIEHHLLPGIPSVRLPRMRRVLRAYCAEHAIPYRETGYWEGWREIATHTRAMADLVRARRSELSVVSPQP